MKIHFAWPFYEENYKLTSHLSPQKQNVASSLQMTVVYLYYKKSKKTRSMRIVTRFFFSTRNSYFHYLQIRLHICIKCTRHKRKNLSTYDTDDNFPYGRCLRWREH